MTNTQSKVATDVATKDTRRNVLIPVIPLERFTYGTLDKSKYLTVRLRSVPTQADSITHDLSVPFYKDGGPEEWLMFRKNLDRVLKGQNLTTGPTQYNMLRSLLQGDGLARFNSYATLRGNETTENFRFILMDMTKYIFPQKAEQRQKRWMRRVLRKPVTMKSREFVSRFTELNEYLTLFPTKMVNGEVVQPSKLPTDEMLDSLEFGSPNAWQREMIRQDYDPTTGSLQDFVEFCERQETTEDLLPRGLKKANTNQNQSNNGNDKGKGKCNNNSSGNDSSKRHKGNRDCLFHGPNTHPTDQCLVLKSQASKMKATYQAVSPEKKRDYKKNQELHAMIAAEVEKRIGKKRKSSTEERELKNFEEMSISVSGTASLSGASSVGEYASDK